MTASRYWPTLVFAVYLVLVSAQYLALRRWGERAGRLSWLPFLMPIGILVIVRYAPFMELSGLFSSSHVQCFKTLSHAAA